MKKFSILALLSVLCLGVGLLLSCSDGDDDDNSSDDAPTDDDGADDDTGDDDADDDDSVDDPLSLLGTGHHLGFITGFSPLTVENEKAVSESWDEAVAAGASIGRIQLDWMELEPEPGVFDETYLTEEIELVTDKGVRPMLTLSTLDSLELTFPEDMMDDEHQQLLSGLSFDSPEVLPRLDALLEWLVPRFFDSGGWLISAGNEVDLRLENYPEEESAIINFFTHAAEKIHEIEPSMPVTVTLTTEAIDSQPSFKNAVMNVMDVACFNYYGQDPHSLEILDASEVAGQIDWILGASGDLPLVIQELGCPAGYEDEASAIGSSLEKQRAFFEAFFTKMAQEDRLRAAVVFTQIDWSPEIADLFSDELLAAGLPEYWVEMYRETLETIGLLRWADGSSRPAWDEFIEVVEGF